VLMLKACYSRLSLFEVCVRSTSGRGSQKVLHLGSQLYMPVDNSTHFSPNLISKILSELVDPLRILRPRPEEEVLLKATIILNPDIQGLTPHASSQISHLRESIQELLFYFLKGLDSAQHPVLRFGRLLLMISTISVWSLLLEIDIHGALSLRARIKCWTNC